MNEIKLLLRKDLLILKNNIWLILKNPLRLLPYGGMVAYFFFIYTMRVRRGAEEGQTGIENLDVDGLPQVDFGLQNVIGGITLLALAFLIFQLFRATKKNVSFFKMADVNLLFTAPVKPENILIYYMGRSIIPSLGGSIIFIIYGASQFADKIEFSFINIAFLVLGFALFFFLTSPIRFLVYTLHTKYGVMQYIQTGVIILAVLLGLAILIPGLMAEKFWQGMFAWIASPWFDLFPIVGWSRAMMSYIFNQNLITALAFFGLYLLAYYVILRLVLDTAGYYYEDVLEATKSNEEQVEKVRGKKETPESSMSLNTKKKLALPDFGVGAKALYWRNYVHASRQDFHPLFGLWSVILAALGIAFAILSNFDWFSHKVLNGYLLMLVGINFFAGIGRGSVGDLKKPYFFLIPASWSSKLWNVIKLDLVQLGLISWVLIIPSVLIAGLDWKLILFYPLCVFLVYIVGLTINMIPKVAFEEGWDQKLIKPLMIGGIFLFGIIPSLVVSVLIFVWTRQFVWMLFAFTIGQTFIAGVLVHVLLDVISRLELKEI
ncbi:Putative ABC exporter [Algoriphagus ornithinivorans]|uniref:Putative ABC exporter n=2 Tax=Algoriphagus TaxID=246875 RepID=A0A1I5IL93_9BACT|nr:putative ABC exporter domain-containing protein [Algoriphagus ornithinivorans]SFO61040.1 Putative ABC exporter [Algoriphagus ornithinivorans]